MRNYASSAALTITLTSLADNAARESTAVDNSSTKYDDVTVHVEATLASGSPANSKCYIVYIYGSEDGTAYTDNATGTNAAITLRTPPNARVGDVVMTPDSGALLYKSNPISVAALFGWSMPRKWGIIVQNLTGLAFAASGNAASYTGVTITPT